MIASVFVTKAMIYAEENRQLVNQHKTRLFLVDADVDKNGLLNWEEFGAIIDHPLMQDIMKEFGDLQEEALRFIFESIDTDASGDCSVDELVQAFCHTNGGFLWRQLMEIEKLMDKRASLSITAMDVANLADGSTKDTPCHYAADAHGS